MTCKRRGELRGGGEGKGRCLHAICLEADVVDVVDRVNIAAREDVSEKRSLTSLTPEIRGDLSHLSRRITPGFLLLMRSWRLPTTEICFY